MPVRAHPSTKKSQPDDLVTNMASYLAAIVENSDDAIIGKDLSGIITSWNRGAQVIFGYEAKDLVGHSIQILFPPERMNEEDVIMAKIRCGERIEHHETIRRHKNGSDVPVSVTVSPIRNKDSAIVGASTILRDITGQREAQRALLETQHRLELIVVERTKALAERNILLREVYHRVKNNLQVVDFMILLHGQQISDPHNRRVLIDLQVRLHALALVHQQLMGSSNLKTFDVAPFIRELCKNIFGGAADERIKLTVGAYPLDVGLDFAVPLGLVVTELVTNSLKHAFPEGIGDVSVVLRPEGHDRVVLTVSDNGVGQPHQTDAGAKEGVGSRIVNLLVAQLQGKIVVHQRAGTTTEISLPLPEAP